MGYELDIRILICSVALALRFVCMLSIVEYIVFICILVGYRRCFSVACSDLGIDSLTVRDRTDSLAREGVK